MLDPRRYQGFPTLDMLVGQPEKPQTSHDSQALAEAVTALTPRTVALCKYLAKIRRGEQTPSLQVETMVASGIDTRMLETFPSAVVAGIREAIVECQSNPPTTWNERLLEIVGREDLTTLLRPDTEWSPSSTSLVVSIPFHSVATFLTDKVCPWHCKSRCAYYLPVRRGQRLLSKLFRSRQTHDHAAHFQRRPALH